MDPHSWEMRITTCSHCCSLCKQSYFDGLDPLCVSPSSMCVFLSRGEFRDSFLRLLRLSLSDAVINTHTAVLRLSDDVILSAAVLLILERGGKAGVGANRLIYPFS